MRIMSFVACLLVFVAVAGIAMADDKPAPAVTGPMPELPNTPAAVQDIVYARQFTLDKGYTYYWFNTAEEGQCQERMKVSSGWLLVLKVDPSFVAPRQTAEPVLYVGNMTAERLNVGYRSGHVVAIVPGNVDLTKTPIYFGTPDLPERITIDKANAELAKAENANIQAFSKTKIDAAKALATKALKAKDKVALLKDVAELLKQYSPAEKQLIKAFAPVEVKPKPEASVNEE